ncbi:glycoside hydrolase family 32 protein [uncultured Serinicoccus sp.]|uniref:glycoside hydrolase family 32 protein n=1 Tax=uncultured Serinicoccus sp. TaxID=735514 RepID=UPI0026250B13|nr:glycoside hydrolase family 32 protein [uncultured Serinicoccus sp.]
MSLSTTGGAPTAYHLRPARGWLNDPNGMVFHDGRWHVFFQHSPQGPWHRQIAWGHASSSDLLRWREHPVAFTPQPGGPDSVGCWSGVLVTGLERPAAVYSGVTHADGRSTVCLRWAQDAGLDTWSDPVVVATTPEVDDVAVMRDPFVFWHGGHRYALLGAGLRSGTPAILLYGCDDIERWEYLGVWLTGDDAALADALPADVWECPQLAVWEGRAALVISLHDRGVLGQVVACTGDLGSDESGRPALVVDRVDLLDDGADFYAPQLAPDGREGAWLMGWVREDGPEESAGDHAGCMTVPRRLVLEGGAPRLVLDPLAAQGLPWQEATPLAGVPLEGQLSLEVGAGGAVLEHPRLGRRALPQGSRVLVDGSVLEIYPPQGPPASFRDPLPWRWADPAGPV